MKVIAMASTLKIISNENAIVRTRRRQGYYYNLVNDTHYCTHNYAAEADMRVYTAQLSEKLERLLDRED